MAQKNIVLKLEESLLEAAEQLAQERQVSLDTLIEDTLRSELSFMMLERVWARNTLSEAEANELAYNELHAFRSGE